MFSAWENSPSIPEVGWTRNWESLLAYPPLLDHCVQLIILLPLPSQYFSHCCRLSCTGTQGYHLTTPVAWLTSLHPRDAFTPISIQQAECCLRTDSFIHSFIGRKWIQALLYTSCDQDRRCLTSWDSISSTQRGSKTVTAALRSFLRKILLSPARARARTHTHTHTHASAVMGHLPFMGAEKTVGRVWDRVEERRRTLLGIARPWQVATWTGGCSDGSGPHKGPFLSQNLRWCTKSQGRHFGLCLKVVRCHRKSLNQKVTWPDCKIYRARIFILFVH